MKPLGVVTTEECEAEAKGYFGALHDAFAARGRITPGALIYVPLALIRVAINLPNDPRVTAELVIAVMEGVKRAGNEALDRFNETDTPVN